LNTKGITRNYKIKFTFAQNVSPVGPTWRIAITVCPLVGLYNMRTTGAPISRVEILLPVNASNSAYMETD